MQPPHRIGNIVGVLQRCPTCTAPISPRRHVLQIAGDLVLDCPACWTTTVFDRAGQIVRRSGTWPALPQSERQFSTASPKEPHPPCVTPIASS